MMLPAAGCLHFLLTIGIGNVISDVCVGFGSQNRNIALPTRAEHPTQCCSTGVKKFLHTLHECSSHLMQTAQNISIPLFLQMINS